MAKLNKIQELYEKYGKEKVLDCLDELNPRTKQIFILYFGMDGENPKTAKEISQLFNSSTNSIRNIIRHNLAKIYKLIERPDEEIDVENVNRKFNRIEELYETYGKEAVDKEFERLKERAIIIKLYYGFNGEIPKSTKEISEITGYTVRQVQAFIYDHRKSLISRLNKPRVDNKMEKMKKLIEMHGEDRVMKAVDKLNGISREMFVMYFGFEGNERKTAKEIAELLDYNYKYVNTNILNNLNKVISILENPNYKYRKNNIKDLYEIYGQERVDEAIKGLTSREKTIVTMFYGLYGNKPMKAKDVAQALNLKNAHVALTALSQCRDKIKIILENPHKETKIDIIKNKFTIKELENAISYINKEARQIMAMCLGLDGNEILSIKEIAELTGLKESKVRGIINYHLDRIEFAIENNSFESFKKNKLEKLFVKYGEERVLEEINKLSDKSKRLVNLYYGLEDGNPRTIQEISKIANIGVRSVSSMVADILRGIEEKIENKVDGRKYIEKLEKLFETYGEERVLNFINHLGIKNRLLLNSYFGINGENAKGIKELCEEFKEDNDKIYFKIKYYLKKIDEDLKLSKDIGDRKDDLDDLFLKYGEERVLEEIDNLNDYDKNLLKLRYGLYGSEVKTVNEISAIYDVKSYNVYSYINRLLRKIEKNILAPEKNYEKNSKIENLFSRYGKERVLEEISKLDEKEKRIIELRFGLGENKKLKLRELSNLYGRSITSTHKEISEIIARIVEILENEKNEILNDKERIDIFNNYSEEEIQLAITRLSLKEQKLINLFFGYSKNIGLYLKTDNINGIIKQVLENIKYELEDMQEEKLCKKKLIEKRRKTFHDLLIVKDKLILKEVLKNLNQQELNLIGLYYGLDGENVCYISDFSKSMEISNYEVRKLVESTIKKINDMLVKKVKR